MLIINADIRINTGTSFIRKIRNCNKLPGILYGKEKKSLLLTLDHNIVFNIQKTTEFYKNKLILIIKNKKYDVKVKALQRHVYKLKLLHIDFLYA